MIITGKVPIYVLWIIISSIERIGKIIKCSENNYWQSGYVSLAFSNIFWFIGIPMWHIFLFFTMYDQTIYLTFERIANGGGNNWHLLLEFLYDMSDMFCFLINNGGMHYGTVFMKGFLISLLLYKLCLIHVVQLQMEYKYKPYAYKNVRYSMKQIYLEK